MAATYYPRYPGTFERGGLQTSPDEPEYFEIERVRSGDEEIQEQGNEQLFEAIAEALSEDLVDD